MALFMKFLRKDKYLSKRLANSSWNSSFHVMSVILGYYYLFPKLLILNAVEELFDEINTGHCNEKELKSYYSIDEKILYSLIFGFYVNDILNMLINYEGRWDKLYCKLFLCALLISSLYIRGAKAAIFISTIINLPNCAIEISKLMYNLRSKSDSSVFKIASYICLLLYLVLWLCVYLWTIPRFLMFLKTKKEISFSSFDSLDFTLLGYFASELFTSNFSRVFLLVFSRKPIIVGLEFCLYDYKRSVTTENDRILNHTEVFNSGSSRFYKKSVNDGIKTQENIATVYQTVRCYMRVKRKLRTIRKRIERKQAVAESRENVT